MENKEEQTNSRKEGNSVTVIKHVKRQQWIEMFRDMVHFSVERMKETHLVEVASSMTLTTLMSLVPLIAVAMTAFALFPGFADERQNLENMLYQSILPDQYTDTIVEYLRSFSTHASGLGAFGVGGLAVTALMLIDKFFVTVNKIFLVRRMRSWGQRALLYWAMITLGPVCIAVSLTISGKTVAIAASGMDPGFTQWIMLGAQILMQVAGYAFLYKFVPNCHVPWKHALFGGAVVAAAGVAVRAGFEHYVSAGTLGSIYGAFVAFPVLMMWFYVSWILIFAGAAVTATIPLLTSGRFADSYRVGNDFVTGVAMLKTLWEARRADRPAVPVSALCKSVDTYPQGARRILEKLAAAGYCGEVMPRSGREPGWALLCDPSKTTLKGACDALLMDGGNELLRARQVTKKRDPGQLFGWYRKFLGNDAINRPIDAIFEENAEICAGN